MRSQDHPEPGRHHALVAQGVVLAGVLGAAALLSTARHWEDAHVVGTLAVLVVGSHMLPIEGRNIHVSGSFMGLVLAMALLGPAPAVALGVAAVLLDALRSRPPAWHLMTDLVTYATFPLVGGLLFEAVPVGSMREDPVLSALVVAGLFVALNMLNFVLVVEQTRLHRAGLPPLALMVRRNWVPVLPWQLAAAAVTAAAAYGESRLSPAMIGLLVLVMFVFGLLLRAVLDAERRGDEVAARYEELSVMHQGLLVAMLESLSLRDRMTARHSAAVARYARAVAASAGMSREEQDLVHTAGLLHDIGKSAFSDELLRTPGPLSAEQRAAIRRHPEDGARILARIRGYERVAEVVRAHHERVDGGGYPNELAGEEIPPESRIIAVVDAYDVMTARDSYREPCGHEEAVAELRRVSGTQLDDRFVELFVAVLARGVEFAHADDHDLEEELLRPRAALARQPATA